MHLMSAGNKSTLEIGLLVGVACALPLSYDQLTTSSRSSQSQLCFVSVVCVYILSCINQSGLTSSLGQQPPSTSEPSAPDVLPLQPQLGCPNVVSAHPNHGGPDVVSLQPEPIPLPMLFHHSLAVSQCLLWKP